MTDKEPEKLARVESFDYGFCVIAGEFSGIAHISLASVHSSCDRLNTAAESFAQRRVDEALELAAVKIGADAESRKCLAYGHDDRYCSYCESYDDAIDTAQQRIRSMKSQGATNG